MSGETHLDFTAKSDGHDRRPSPGTPASTRSSCSEINKKQVEVKEKKDGALWRRSQQALEAMAKSSPSPHERRPPGPDHGVGAHRRRKGRQDPFAGEWTQDLSKTRMRQGPCP